MLKRVSRLRAYATAAARQPGKVHSSLTVRINREQPEEAAPILSESSTAENGAVTVSTFDHQGPTSVVGVILPAGSRWEAASAPGAAGLYRASILRNTDGRSVLKTIREAELLGARITTTLSRENVIISGEFLRDALSDVVPALLRHALSTEFSAHEFQDAASSLASTVSECKCNVTAAIENVHIAAFQNIGLGHPLQAQPDQITSLKRRQVRDHLSSAVKHRGLTVVGLGTKHEDLERVVSAALHSFPESETAAIAEPVKVKSAAGYHGGDFHVAAPLGDNGVAAVAFSSNSHAGIKERAAALVLKEMLVRKQPVPFGPSNGSSTLLGKVLADDVVATAFESTFTDASLFGVAFEGPSSELLNSAQKFTGALKALTDAKAIDEKLLVGARSAATVAAEPLLAGSNKGAILADVSLLNNTTGSSNVQKAISGVSAADISSLAKTLLKSAPSVSTVGNVRELFQSFNL